MNSLRRALLAYILCGLSVVLVLSGAAVYLVARGNLRAQFDESLLARARTFAGLVVEEGPPGESLLELEYDRSLEEADIGALVRISGQGQGTLVESPGWPDLPGPVDATLDGEPTYRDVRVGGAAARLVAIARRAAWDPGDTPDGREWGRVITVEVIERTAELRRAEAGVLGGVALGAVLAVVGASLAVWLGVRRGLAPVRELGTAVDRIETRRLELPETAAMDRQELRPIVGAIESLLSRMRDAMERERRFTDAAAHELRTPIAEMRTITDVVDRWPEPDRLLRGLKDAQAVIGRMEGLLESLLAMSRGVSLDERASEDVPLLPLARSLVEDATRRLGRDDLSWSFQGPDSVSWRAPRGVITSILRNLIENAAEYTEPGGSVRLSVRSKSNEESSLEIANGPVTLPPADLERLFEPFWRADGSRTDHAHRGLGLAIVDVLAHGAGLTREAEATPDRRLRIRLTLTK